MLRNISLLFLVLGQIANATCVPRNSQGAPVPGNQDGIARFLAASDVCPKDVLALRAGLLKSGLRLKSTMVNNRSFHNPEPGSFSFFEMVLGAGLEAGDVFFGHFTAATENGDLVLDQAPQDGALMIELIAWDPAKQVYNFYELIGDGETGRWFYRGDSKDILHDVRQLHLQPNPAQPQFGRTLRCAGCHTGGGPILKELAAPHNDWWVDERPLSLGDLKPAPSLKAILDHVVGADALSQAVSAGMAKLEASPTFQQAKQGLTLPEQLRPLFCPVEINLESDALPLESPSAQVAIPAAFFVDPRLATGSVGIDKTQYLAALKHLDSRFPEVARVDGDHAWLTPVKAQSDIHAIDQLVKSGVVNEAFVQAVLAVDFTNPVTSAQRCQLLKQVPQTAQPGWQQAFLRKQNLSGNAQVPATKLLAACRERLSQSGALEDLVRLLFQRRQEVFSNEISKNPLGQILEPRFRVIFPRLPQASTPGHFALTERCEVEEK